MKIALIIEDNHQNMYLLTYLLRESGYEVAQAYDGPTGIKRSRVVKPYVVLLDIQLPGMNGYAVAKELREIHGQRIPIIAVTSYAMPGDREKALEAGASGYIEKPIDPDTFVAQLEKIVRSHYKTKLP